MTVTVDRTVEQFTAAPSQLFINGQWVDAASGKTFETPNPATGEHAGARSPRATPRTSTAPSGRPGRRSTRARGAA